MNFNDIKIMVDAAVKQGACKNEISKIRKLRSFTRVKNHPQAPYWVFWYASKSA